MKTSQPSRRATLAETPLEIPMPVPAPQPTAPTGTVDDDDAPEDERDGENEARVHEQRDDMEAPEEFQRDDEDRD
jgi:hypothetical protein